MFGSNYFSGHLHQRRHWATVPAHAVSAHVYLNIGPNAESQSSNTGMFQNRFVPSGTAIWTKGRHTLELRRELDLYPAQHSRQAHRHGHDCHAGLQPVRARIG